VEGFQALGGTGALRLAAAFLKNILHFDTVYVSNPTWENHRGVFKSAGFTQFREYRYWNKEMKDLDFSGMCEDLLSAPPNSVIILHAVAHNPTGVDLTQEQWKEICEICKEKKLFVLMDCAYQGFASGNLDSDAWAVRYFADQDIDMFIAQSFSKNFGLYNERVGNLIVVSKDETKLPEIRSQMEIQIRIMWSNPANHGARIVATILNNKVYYEEWRGQIVNMSNRIKNMRQELVNNLKKLGTPGNWDHITKQIGMFSFTGLTEKQVRYLLSKYIFLLKSGRISLAGLTSRNVSFVAKVIDEAVRAHPILELTDASGEPAIGSKRYFVEFAKRKLDQSEYNVIKTLVVVDGVIMKQDEEMDSKKVQSVESFVKVTLVGSLSSSASSEIMSSKESKESLHKAESKKIEHSEENLTEELLKEALSTSTQPGTPRSSVKTFKTRSIQTLKADAVKDMYQPKEIPARFEGTMLTPVYFDGLMITPEKLDTLLTEADRKGEHEIPVRFQGGMLTAAFKTIAENLELGAGTEPVNVKFHGKLKGLRHSEDDAGIPVSFDGSMVPQAKKTKPKS
ncbi:unnamed protein product, partial [Candidula unifasciata]